MSLKALLKQSLIVLEDVRDVAHDKRIISRSRGVYDEANEGVCWRLSDAIRLVEGCLELTEKP